jgi:hypothetical protein
MHRGVRASLRRLLIAGTVLLAGCGQCSETEQGPADAAVPARPTGAAYLVVRRVGLVRIANGVIETVHPSRFLLGAFQVGPDRAAYFMEGADLLRTDAAGTKVVARRLPSPTHALAIANDGTVYAAAESELARVAAGATTRIPPVGEKLPCKYIALDARDTLYCSATPLKELRYSSPPSTLHRWNGSAWEAVTVPLADAGPAASPNINGLHRGPDGRLVIAISGGFFAIGGDGVARPLAPPAGGESTLFSMRVTQGGDALVWGQPTSYLLGQDGTWHVQGTPGAAAEPNPAMDTLGRFWFVPKTGGFGVMDSTGASRGWPACSALGEVLDFAVVDSGPLLPEELPGAIRGPVRGQLLRGGNPLANAKIVIASPHALLDEPESEGCEIRGKSELLPASRGGTDQTTTDAEGRFVFNDVPRAFEGLLLLNDREQPLPLRIADPPGECWRQMSDANGVDLGAINLP